MSAAANFAHEWFSLQIILHTLQKQALGGQGRPGAAAVTAFQNGGNFRRVQPACARFAQSARDQIYPVFEKPEGTSMKIPYFQISKRSSTSSPQHMTLKMR
jgi:hypothetical protein